MNLHLVYPTDQKRNSSPWSEGNFIYNHFSKTYKVYTYNWLSFGSINPEPGDVLIGHAHPNPLTIFRKSMKKKGWSKVILFQPYNEDVYQIGYLKDILPFCDCFLALCGNYWFDRIEKSIFLNWKPKMVHLDLGIESTHFPYVKEIFNKEKKRKFLYIGNDYAFNNYAKNFNYLKTIIQNFGKEYFATAGNRKISGVKHYGWLDILSIEARSIIKNYDFLILTSSHDANPAVILEAMSWGLIPIITRQSGYSKEKNFFYIPLDNTNETLKILDFVQNISNDKIKEMSLYNLKRVQTYYNSDKFCRTIEDSLFKNRKNYSIKINTHNNFEIEKKIKVSPNHYLKPINIYSILKANLSIIFKKYFNIKKLL